MPEGHSIHRIARQFNDVFTGGERASLKPTGALYGWCSPS